MLNYFPGAFETRQPRKRVDVIASLMWRSWVRQELYNKMKNSKSEK